MQVLHQLPVFEDENVIVGLNPIDDAGVYKLTEELAIITTVDFFTPIVDDPYTYGLIAAANALSDIYAMGGMPKIALSIAGFPKDDFPNEILIQILRGAAEKLKEAGVILIGGHTIDDVQLKYGLAIAGVIHPKRVITNAGAQPEDKLLLTKPLGTGSITTGLKFDLTTPEVLSGAVQSMVSLNKTASEIMLKYSAHACTDVTGYGLLGHAYQMAETSGVGIEIKFEEVPILDGAVDLIKNGVCTGASAANRRFLKNKVKFHKSIPEEIRTIFFEAETSGGLLIAIAPEKAAETLLELRSAGISEAKIIGEVLPEPAGKIIVK